MAQEAATGLPALENLALALTQRINNALHIQFGIANLYHRMIFTACALVAERYGAGLRKVKDLGYDIFKRRILDTLSSTLRQVAKGSDKLQILLDVYGEIEMDTSNDQEAINGPDWGFMRSHMGHILELAEANLNRILAAFPQQSS